VAAKTEVTGLTGLDAEIEAARALARAEGFDAMQFNFVFADNPARRLYERLGWKEIGRIPGALGPTDAVIYWRAVP